MHTLSISHSLLSVFWFVGCLKSSFFFFLLQQHVAENATLHQHNVRDRARRMFAAHAGRRLYYAAEERHCRGHHGSVFAVPVVRSVR